MKALVITFALTGCVEGSLKSDTNSITPREEFDRYVQPMFVQSCNSCHGTALAYDMIIEIGYEQPYTGAMSFNYAAVNQQFEFAHAPGTPSSADGAHPLTADQRQLILQWLLDEEKDREP
ncbi:MAG: hypothetical protein QM831_32740 [Kofleriaceae bacterium]